MNRKKLLNGFRILVVDDEPDLRDVISSRFELEGSEVMLAENGNNALDIMRSNEFDAVVSDVRMPSGTGMELLDKMNELLKDSARRPHVILITGFSDLKSEDAIARGATALLVKPFDLDEMITTLSAAINNRKLTQHGELT
jgi:DNA-binding NtrC family response regulator